MAAVSYVSSIIIYLCLRGAVCGAKGKKKKSCIDCSFVVVVVVVVGSE